MNRTILFAVAILGFLPVKAFAYVGPAIAGIFGSMIGLAGVVAISVVFILAWPLAKLYMSWKNKKKAEAGEVSVDAKDEAEK